MAVQVNIDEHLCSALDPYLQEVNKKYLKLNGEETKKCVQAVMAVVEYVIESLKQNIPGFNQFQELIYCGSYYDGLRIKEATEFDMNLVILTNYQNGYPILLEIGEGEKLRVRRNVSADDIRYKDNKNILKENMSRSGFVRADVINNWFQSVIDTCFNTSCCQHFKEYTFSFRTNIPARTLEICSRHKNIKIDVDLVPSIRFSNRLPKLKNILRHQDMLAVPKKYANGIYWRAAFPEQEKELLSDCGHLLYIGRLLKGLREKLNLSLKTYHIKILLLSEAASIKEQNHYRLFWQKSPGFLFIYMLQKLEDTLQRKSLKGFWMSEERFNQFSDIELTNMYNQVKRVREKLIYTLRNSGQRDLKMLIDNLFSD